MHEEILTKEQKELLPLLKDFSGQFGLVGGTAIALHIGHRRSIDFDLFTQKHFRNTGIRDQIRAQYKIEGTFVDKPNELTIVVNGVKVTFYKYPFDVIFSDKLNGFISLPDLQTLAAMKAFALGRRAKWKDYVDLYFIFKNFSLTDVTKKAKDLFGGEFNERLLREQLAYFDDIDYTESIDYLAAHEVPDDEVRSFLKEISLQK
jgi:hypothetical protein